MPQGEQWRTAERENLVGDLSARAAARAKPAKSAKRRREEEKKRRREEEKKRKR